MATMPGKGCDFGSDGPRASALSTHAREHDAQRASAAECGFKRAGTGWVSMRTCERLQNVGAEVN